MDRFKETQQLKSDILIIGGGGTGLSAAITAQKSGASVMVVSKGRVGYANNTYISAGAFASTGWGEPQDNPGIHFKDTIVSGRFINDIKLTGIITRQSHDQVRFLEDCGVDFSKKDKAIRVGLAPGHSYPRNVWGKNSRGSDFMLPLIRYARDKGIQLIDHTIITRLFVQDGKIAGAMGFDTNGRLLEFSAKSIILATGGFAQIYQNNNNASGITGDGHALAYHAGLGLRDMEFVQFYPTYGTLYEVTVARAGARLKNSANEDILDKHGLADTTSITRDKLSRAVFSEIHSGFGVDGGVILDIGAIPENVIDRIRGFLPKGAHQQDKNMIVKPTAHFCMGGIKVDGNAMTEIGGLYGAGEVCGGVHGANRLGGNALSEVFSMGQIAGREAAAFSQRNDHVPRTSLEFDNEKLRLNALLNSPLDDTSALTQHLKRTMWQNGGIIRNEAGLYEAIEKIAQMYVRLENAGVRNFHELMKIEELKNMLVVSEAVCRSALTRMESRGSHYREDYPEEDNGEWLCNIEVKKESSHMMLSIHPIDRKTLSQFNINVS